MEQLSVVSRKVFAELPFSNHTNVLSTDYIAEGYTTIFEGPQRCGKTLAMTIWAYYGFLAGRKIFSNYWLNFQHESLKFKDVRLANGASRFRNARVPIDELNFYYDCRRSLSSANVKFGAFLLQQKKQGCDILGTTHDLTSLDGRLQRNYDFLVRPRVYPEYPEKPLVLHLEIFNGPSQKPFSKTMDFLCEPFLGLYNTHEVYDPFEGMTKKELKEMKL